MWTETTKNGKCTCKEKPVSEVFIIIIINLGGDLYAIILILSYHVVLTLIKFLDFWVKISRPPPKASLSAFGSPK